jgi:hypothetical protein
VRHKQGVTVVEVWGVTDLRRTTENVRFAALRKRNRERHFMQPAAVAKLWIQAAAVVALSACGVRSAPPSEMPSLTKRIDELNTKVAALQKTVNDNESSRKFDDMLARFDRVAYLTPGSTGYSAVRMDLGYLTVAIDDIKPYANGSKVRLRFGNPFVATINGLKTKLEWGTVNKDGAADNENEKSRQITLTDPLLPGAWTHVEIVLDGVPPSNLGFVRLSEVTHTGIALRR